MRNIRFVHRLKGELLSEVVEDELVLYDRVSDETHYVPQPQAGIFQSLQELSAKELATKFFPDSSPREARLLVEAALESLWERNLIVAKGDTLTRREFHKKATGALLLPAILSMSTSGPAAAQSILCGVDYTFTSNTSIVVPSCATASNNLLYTAIGGSGGGGGGGGAIGSRAGGSGADGAMGETEMDAIMATVGGTVTLTVGTGGRGGGAGMSGSGGDAGTAGAGGVPSGMSGTAGDSGSGSGAGGGGGGGEGGESRLGGAAMGAMTASGGDGGGGGGGASNSEAGEDASGRMGGDGGNMGGGDGGDGGNGFDGTGGGMGGTGGTPGEAATAGMDGGSGSITIRFLS